LKCGSGMRVTMRQESSVREGHVRWFTSCQVTAFFLDITKALFHINQSLWNDTCHSCVCTQTLQGRAMVIRIHCGFSTCTSLPGEWGSHLEVGWLLQFGWGLCPKGSCVGSLVSSVAVLERGGTFRKWGLMGGSQVIVDVTLWKD
jgi:hypothetical protein